MAKLNATKTKVAAIELIQETTTNYEDAPAFTLKAKDRLIERVLGSFWNEDLFYTKGTDQSKAIVKDINEVAASDPKFVLQLAAYARNFLYLRTAPQVLLTEAANIDACKPFIREYTPKIVRRADELAEVVAYQLNRNNGKTNFPNSLKDGLAKAFSNFDEYQLNKYDSNKSSVAIGDVVKLVHPKFEGTEEYRKALYNYLTKDEVSEATPKIWALKQLLAKDTLDEEARDLIRKSSVTWETLISKFGSTKETWELVAPNMGYMALLRNLRNLEEKGVDLAPILERIKDPAQVERSKQLPFRFYSAWKEVSNQETKRAIVAAFKASMTNAPIPGTMAILVDVSASMDSKLSAKSKVSHKEIGAVLGVMAVAKAQRSTVVAFGDSAAKIDVDPDDSPMNNISKINNASTIVGHSTNAWAAFDLIKDEQFDRIVLISDMQCYDNTSLDVWFRRGQQSVHDQWNEYHKKNKNAWLYSLDVSAYGTKQTSSKSKNVVLMNGWSDKILDYMNLVENKNVMEQEIKKW